MGRAEAAENRTNCASIRGTEYASEEEREWYLNSCQGDEVISDLYGICSYPWPCEWAKKVVNCESTFNPSAVGSGRYMGLWQVDGGSLDPYVNTAQAYQQYVEWQRGQRGLPWPVCGR